MPLPKPRAGESQDDFIGRCMGDAQDEFPDEDQRAAVCFDLWRDRNKEDISGDDLAEDGGLQEPDTGRRCPEGMRFDPSSGRCVRIRGNYPGKPKKPRRKIDVLSLSMERALEIGEPDEALRDLDAALVAARETARRQDEPQPLGNRSVPGHDDPFLVDELEMAQALSRAAFDIADDEVLPLYEELLDDPENFDQDKLDEVNREAESVWQDVWPLAVVSVAASIASAFAKGEASIQRGATAGSISAQQVLDQMLEVNGWHTNRFFNEQVLPSLQREVAKVLGATGAMDVPDFTTVREIMERRLKSVPYWRTVANASASRVYHYGLLKAADAQGMTTFRFKAILDDRTSDICRTVNGTTWHIPDALLLMEQVAASGADPSVVKQLMPWVRPEDVQGKDATALRDMGVMVPPLHGNCRSTLEVF